MSVTAVFLSARRDRRLEPDVRRRAASSSTSASCRDTGAADAIARAAATRSRRRGSGSFLAVLKRFGDVRSPGLLSFPRPGVTLALDLPNSGPATRELLARMEAISMRRRRRALPGEGRAHVRATRSAARFPRSKRFARTSIPRCSSTLLAPRRRLAMRSVLVIGATSAIAEATARQFAARGDALFLVARNTGRLAAIADDLRIRGAAAVHTAPLDVTDARSRSAALAAADAAIGRPDVALVAHGTLPDQARMRARRSRSRRRAGRELHRYRGDRVDDREPDGGGAARNDRGRHVGCGRPRTRQQLRIRQRQGRLSTFLAGLRHRLHRPASRSSTIGPASSTRR